MIELILVRHGETDSNVKGTYLGWTDVPLNAHGIEQANAAKEKLKGMMLNGIYSSPLQRARHTAEIINENFGMEILLAEGLKERNFGAWDNLTYKEIVSGFPQEHELWVKDWANYCMKDGESSVQAYSRVVGFIEELVKSHKEGTFLIVTHLGCVRKILSHLLGMGLEGSWHFKVDNAGISRIQINDEGYAYITALNL